MAKVEGTQSIASALLKKYQAALTSKTSTSHVRIRMPFTLPKAKAGGIHESTARAAQRARFNLARTDFNNLGTADRSNWYDNAPVWNSYLWYYNFFILSSLGGNADFNAGGLGVIKLIQQVQTSLGTAGGVIAIPTAIDPKKSVVMVWGGGHTHDEGFGEDFGFAWAWICYPVPYILNSTSVSVLWSETPSAAGNIALQIIEYI